jgi:hypothetical protein
MCSDHLLTAADNAAAVHQSRGQCQLLLGSGDAGSHGLGCLTLHYPPPSSMQTLTVYAHPPTWPIVVLCSLASGSGAGTLPVRSDSSDASATSLATSAAHRWEPVVNTACHELGTQGRLGHCGAALNSIVTELGAIHQC